MQTSLAQAAACANELKELSKGPNQILTIENYIKNTGIIKLSGAV